MIEISKIDAILGLLLMFFAIFMMNVSSVYIKLILQSNSTFTAIEVMFVRGFFQMIINQLVMQVFNMLTSFSGVLVIVYFSAQDNAKQQSTGLAQVSHFMFIAAIVMNFVSATAIGFTNVVIKQLKGLHWSILSGFQGSMSLVASLIIWLLYRFVYIRESFQYNFTLNDYHYMIGLGIFAGFGQIFWVKALLLDKAGRCASLTLLNIVFGFFFDVLIFNYNLRIYEILGGSVIILCSALVFIIKLRTKNE
ncbi:transmembrane protein 20-like [Stylonychia lemnae]|uniref:Transmembrane protein 20-like n=1 Tax=Stylonychia lemnae TaxID=5949 RepID=A0A078BA78_STYLE|nr:transmembrane protein 20-like [Stylonychia lemnae]|eukprot:CDW91425.1 transmembrane protein 20-like [Stylonychia lemnae]